MPSARVDSPKDAKDDADRAAVPMGLIGPDTPLFFKSLKHQIRL